MKNWEALRALREGKTVTHPNVDGPVRPDGYGFGLLLEHFDNWALYEGPGHDWAEFDVERTRHDHQGLRSEESGETGHDFAWACSALATGSSVRRKCWSKDRWIVCGPSYDSPIRWAKTDSYAEQPFVLSKKQIMATDWVRVE